MHALTAECQRRKLGYGSIGMCAGLANVTAGKGAPLLDEALAALSPEDRAKAQEAARRWLGGK